MHNLVHEYIITPLFFSNIYQYSHHSSWRTRLSLLQLALSGVLYSQSFFPLSSGVRQGGVLSPYLFRYTLTVLLIALGNVEWDVL